jgi:AraC-like DNA-binding protein
MTSQIETIKPELLTGLDFRILAIQRATVRQWWNYRGVMSPFSRLWLPLGGQAAVRHHEHRYGLKRGCIHLVPAFALHDCECRHHLDHYILHFAARLPTGIDLFSVVHCDYQLEAPAEALGLFQRLEAIYPGRKLPCFDPFRAEYQRFSAQPEPEGSVRSPDQWFEARGILHLLLAPFLKSAQSREGIHSRAARWFQVVQQFIHEHMGEELALADIARVAGLNPTYFSDRFQQLVGIRPLEYLTRRRVERAQYLLLTTQASVKEVAFAVGLKDPAYFTRVFGRICRCSPSEYRRSHL